MTVELATELLNIAGEIDDPDSHHITTEWILVQLIKSMIPNSESVVNKFIHQV